MAPTATRLQHQIGELRFGLLDSPFRRSRVPVERRARDRCRSPAVESTLDKIRYQDKV